MYLKRILCVVFTTIFFINFDLFARQISNDSDQLFMPLNQKAEKLKILINRFIESGALSSRSEEHYAKLVVSFENLMQEVAAQGIDTEDFTQNYIDVYKTWAPYMITEPSLLEEITNAGSRDIPSGQQPDDANTARAQKVQDLLQLLLDAIMDKQDKFHNQISAKIQTLGEYSPKSQAEFLKLLRDEFTSFTTSVQAEKTFVKNEYFQFLISQNPEFNDDNLSQSDREFLQSVDYIVRDAIACVRAFMLDLTSRTVKQKMIDKLNK